MRTLRKIFESLSMFTRDPVMSIKDARARFLTDDATADDKVLLGRILDAVIAIAEDDAKKASKPSGDGKGKAAA